MKINKKVRTDVNNVLATFCKRWRTPSEFRELVEELYNKFNLEFLITGYPDSSTPGTKSWNVSYTIDGEDVENSYLVINKYEGSGNTDEYNMYIS